MNRRVAVWIDHGRATIIWVEAGRIDVEHIEAGVERKHRLGSGARPGAPEEQQELTSDGTLAERRHRHVTVFLDQVVDRVAPAGQILLLGRGMLKSRLARRIGECRSMAARLAEVIDTDRTTERQMVMRVRQYYGFALKRRE